MRLSIRREFWPWLLLLALLSLRLCWLNAYPFDSDEPQHAHVAWVWTQGLLPYRDVFDNHGPLFGLLNAPVLAWVGERADALSWLRLAVQPWYFLALFAAWYLGRRFYGRRVALAAVLLVALWPRFFLVMGQFRTDDLWAALWLASLAVLAMRGGSFLRGLGAGLLAGAALCVSQKTVMLLVTAAVAGMVVGLARRSAWRLDWRLPAGYGLGLLLLPVLFLAWFAAQGALEIAVYNLVGYNTAETGRDANLWRLLLFFVLAPAAVAVAVRRQRRSHGARAPWRIFIALQSVLVVLAVECIWPLVTRQDFLPAIPLLLLALCGWAARRWRWAASPRRGWLAVGAVVALELVLLASNEPPWRDALRGQRAELGSVLRYTDAGDSVMDAKGASIFRPRPYYLVLETMARQRLQHGLMADTVPEALAEHGTMLVIRRGLPDLADAFVLRNYLPAAGQVRIAGLLLPGGDDAHRFEVEVPGDYTLVDGRAKVMASLDGAAPADHWTLTRGMHRLDASSGQVLALVGSKAWERGWRPALEDAP